MKNLCLFQFVVCIRFTTCPQEVKEYPTTQGEDVNMPKPEETGPLLEERKLEYVHLANGIQPRSQTSVSLIISTSLLLLNARKMKINKSISVLLAKNRARNNASNRSEALYTLLDDQNGGDTTPMPSCACTDAKPVDRDLQMKYDMILRKRRDH